MAKGFQSVKVQHPKRFFEKSLTMPKKLKKRGGALGFFNIHSVAKLKRMKGDPLVEKKIKKVARCQKTERRTDLLVSAGNVCYAGKKEASFSFRSLGQMVQFDTIKFRRTCRTIFVTSGVSKKNNDEKP